jgi:glycosyltransferase involved in cell wall biosynthesis
MLAHSIADRCHPASSAAVAPDTGEAIVRAQRSGSQLRMITLTTLEAMACRCASVVPAAGGTSEYAIHGENALVVDTASETEILRQMTELLQNSATIDTLADAGHQTSLRYSTEGAAESIAKALGLLI